MTFSLLGFKNSLGGFEGGPQLPAESEAWRSVFGGQMRSDAVRG